MVRVYTQTFGVVGAILERNGKILLVKEAQGRGKGKWSQPAGWIDVGENPIDAVKRGVEEEIEKMDTATLRDLDIKKIVKDYLTGKRYPLEIITHTISE